MTANSHTPKTHKAEEAPAQTPAPIPAKKPEEIGGRGGLDPARYGDWEIGGKCVDF